MKKSILIFLFLVSGCKEYSQYQKKEHRVTIVPNKVAITSADVADWKVGTLRRETVSKGIRVKLEFPLLEKEHLQDLVKTVEIDSWLIRIKRRTMVTTETLDHFYIPLLIPGQDKKEWRIKQIPAGFVNLYYAAAAVSTRFEKFSCPAFNHKKYITDYEVVDVFSRDKVIRGNRRTPSFYSGKLTKYDYRPFPVNAGMEMNGEYRFEIALFNSKEKLRKSNWFELHQGVKVLEEKSLSKIKGCENFKIPENNSTIDDIQDFKFGR